MDPPQIDPGSMKKPHAQTQQFPMVGKNSTIILYGGSKIPLIATTSALKPPP